jgi:polyhydroxyalkanoate synthesis regulator phasin
MTVKKKKNPQDATMRNIDALKKRIAKLEAEVKKLKLRDEAMFN